jgi:hypothetical protein
VLPFRLFAPCHTSIQSRGEASPQGGKRNLLGGWLIVDFIRLGIFLMAEHAGLSLRERGASQAAAHPVALDLDFFSNPDW